MGLLIGIAPVLLQWAIGKVRLLIHRGSVTCADHITPTALA